MVGVSEISRNLSINNNMAFRVLKTLEQENWIYFDEATGKYQLTLKPMHLVSSALQRININTAAAPIIYALWEKVGESTYLAILNADKVFYLQHLDSIHNIKVSGAVGGLYPARISAPGKALLAYCSDEYLNKYIFCNNLTANKSTKEIDVETYKKQLQEIKKNGYATDNEEYGPGIFCYAAPIFDYTGAVIASVGCSGATALYGSIDKFIEKNGKYISEAAKQISTVLGYTGNALDMTGA